MKKGKLLFSVLFTASLFYSCSNSDELISDDSVAQEQVVANDPIAKETFVSLDKATEVADLFLKQSKISVSTRSGNAQSGQVSVETLDGQSINKIYFV